MILALDPVQILFLYSTTSECCERTLCMKQQSPPIVCEIICNLGNYPQKTLSRDLSLTYLAAVPLVLAGEGGTGSVSASSFNSDSSFKSSSPSVGPYSASYSL